MQWAEDLLNAEMASFQSIRRDFLPAIYMSKCMMCNCAKIVDFNQVEKSIKWIPSDMHDINFQSVINHFRFFS